MPSHLRVAARHAATALLSGSCFTLSTTAHAQDEVQSCDALDLPNRVYGAGGSVITPTLGRVASALAGAEQPITILYSDPSQCTGLQAFADNSATAHFKYWQPGSSTPFTCAAPSAGQALDFAYSPAPEECNEVTLGSEIVTFPGAVHTLHVITPKSSRETVISREALYFVYGFGTDSQAPPWTDETKLYQRGGSSFLQRLLGLTIGVDPASFRGQSPTTDGGPVDFIVAAGAANPDAPLGFASGATASSQANREVIKTLAYQHTGQDCGYWPSLTQETFDQINVRNGRYQLWTPSYFLARVNTEGAPVNPTVTALIDWFQGAETTPSGVDVTAAVIASGDIPICAMQVTREGLTGAVSSTAPQYPCNCYFDLVATGSTQCSACTTNDDCTGTEFCRRGYCEAY